MTLLLSRLTSLAWQVVDGAENRPDSQALDGEKVADQGEVEGKLNAAVNECVMEEEEEEEEPKTSRSGRSGSESPSNKKMDVEEEKADK